jgi:hypothetical protein
MFLQKLDQSLKKVQLSKNLEVYSFINGGGSITEKANNSKKRRSLTYPANQ